jgi:hypothetical protein
MKKDQQQTSKEKDQQPPRSNLILMDLESFWIKQQEETSAEVDAHAKVRALSLAGASHQVFR